MIFRLQFKTPDVENQLTEPEKDQLAGFLSKWIKYSEYIEIEFDTVAGTARVIQVS